MATSTPRKVDAIALYLDHLSNELGRSPRTWKERRRLLYRMDADRQAFPYGLLCATEDELRAWLYHPDRWSPGTIALYRAVVQSFFRFATQRRRPLIDYDPSLDLPRPSLPVRVPRPCADAELFAALDRLGDPWRTMLRLAAYQGLRCCEISRLDREDVTQLRTYVQGKGKREGYVPTDPDVWAAVRDLPPGPVFRRRDGRRCGAHYITSELNRRLRRAGVTFTAHQGRHWFGTGVLNAPGSNLRVAQELLRHASPTSTAIYTLVTSEARAAAVSHLPRPVSQTTTPIAA